MNGIAVGASFDQAIKQLPARHRIGSVAYSTYSKSADLGNGIPFDVSISIADVLLTIGAPVTRIFNRFARLNAIRAFFQVVTFATLLWALVNYGR